MARVNNPVLGHITCATCGQRATVHQNSRGKGRFLYSKGCECKAQQSAGATFQNDLWARTEWLPGVEPIRPPNVEPEHADFDPTKPGITPTKAAPAAATGAPATPEVPAATPGDPRNGGSGAPAQPGAKPKRTGLAFVAALVVGVLVAAITKGRATL